MKKTALILATISAFSATQATAGSLSDPVIEEILIVEETTSSSSGTGLVVLLAVLSAIAVIAD